LFIGLIVLYILHFQDKSDFIPLPSQAQNGTPIMLTVNNDSIIEHFTLAEILKNDLETEAKKYQDELATMQSTLEEKYKNYQINLQKNVLTQTQIQNAEKQLQQEAGQFQALQEQYSQILAMKEMSVQKEITDSIINAAQRVNDTKYKADYVLATSSGSAILYANKVYDITKDVIKELNDAYKKSSK
jgi:outer membrane protein